MDLDEFSLSLTEWLLMSAVWELGSADASTISQMLGRKFKRVYSPKTTSIMLSRLADKGLLQSNQVVSSGPGRPAHLYSPTLPRDLAVRGQFKRFLRDHLIEKSDYEILRTVLTS